MAWAAIARHDRRVRGLLALALLATAVTSAAGQGRRGQLARVEAPPSTRVWVKGGRFAMGTPPEDADVLYYECRRAQNLDRPPGGFDLCGLWRLGLERRPLREVHVDSFWIDRDEVTVASYRTCVHAGACPLGPLVAGDPRYVVDAWPQVNVQRDEAAAYCAWRGGRLPTEAEWEKAARGSDFRTWPWGDRRAETDFNHGQHRVAAMVDLEDMVGADAVAARVLGDPDDSDGHAILAPPGQLRGGDGPYGTHDQAGNAAEWVQDAWSIDGFDGLAEENPYRQPMNELDGAMIRGGSWRDPPFLGRADLPHYVSTRLVPASRLPYVGFRCVYTATVPIPTMVLPSSLQGP